MATYIGVVHRDEGSDFGVSFPDFPGCITAASNLDEVRGMAEEALAFHAQGMIDDGLALPEPTDLDTIMRDRDFQDGLAILVPLRLSARTVRVNITVPEDALHEIDAYAEQHGYTRSGFLVSAARKAMIEVDG